MSDNNLDANTGSSPEIDSNSADQASTASAAPKSAREFLTERSQQAKARSAAKVPNGEALAGEPAKDSDPKGASETPVPADKKNTSDPRVQKRMDQLTARYHESERKSAAQNVELQKYKKVAEMLEAEVSRMEKLVKLDPHQEAQLRAQRDRDIQDFNKSIVGKDEELYTESTSQWAVEQRADEISQEINDLVSDRYDLTSLEEVLIRMLDTGDTAEKAARYLHESRVQKSQRHKTPAHPGTTANSGASSKAPDARVYQGTGDIANALRERIALRTGRAGKN